MNTQSSPARSPRPQPFWPPLAAGVALGLVLLLTFLWTGHGLGATGASTRFTAWLGEAIAPAATSANAYLGPMVDGGNPLKSWISWGASGFSSTVRAAWARPGAWWRRWPAVCSRASVRGSRPAWQAFRRRRSLRQSLP